MTAHEHEKQLAKWVGDQISELLCSIQAQDREDDPRLEHGNVRGDVFARVVRIRREKAIAVVVDPDTGLMLLAIARDEEERLEEVILDAEFAPALGAAASYMRRMGPAWARETPVQRRGRLRRVTEEAHAEEEGRLLARRLATREGSDS